MGSRPRLESSSSKRDRGCRCHSSGPILPRCPKESPCTSCLSGPAAAKPSPPSPPHDRRRSSRAVGAGARVSRVIRIGAGSAWWGDRIEPARWNAERGDLDYLCFETMAEATVSAAQVRARRDPTFPGFDTYLDDRFEAVLPG